VPARVYLAAEALEADQVPACHQSEDRRDGRRTMLQSLLVRADEVIQ